jgi:hypothetical protein
MVNLNKPDQNPLSLLKSFFFSNIILIKKQLIQINLVLYILFGL